MGKWRVVTALFLFTCILSICNVKADSYLNFGDIKIPSMQGIYTSSKVKKTTFSDQYVKTIDAIDYVSSDQRAIGARLKGITTSYVTTQKGRYVTLPAGSSNLAQAPNTYQLQLKANKWTVTAVHYTGSWVLDDYLKK